MEQSAYLDLAAREDEGWYYQMRLDIVRHLLARHLPTHRKLRILDIGSGTGGSTQALLPYGHVTGMEPSPLARQLCQKKFPTLSLRPWTIDELPDAADEPFDLVMTLCVFYHQNVLDPQKALAHVAAVQREGGWFVWNEPAYPYLWRQHDRQTAAARRFYPKEMKKLLEANGYELVQSGHLLSWAYPLALALSLLDRWRWGKDRRSTSSQEGLDHKPLPWPLSPLLRLLGRAEWQVQEWGLRIPFGVSYLLVARKSERAVR